MKGTSKAESQLQKYRTVNYVQYGGNGNEDVTITAFEMFFDMSTVLCGHA
jgi:hypothetical protein